MYLVTHEYDAGDMAWNDPVLGVPWQISDPILTERDRSAPSLR